MKKDFLTDLSAFMFWNLLNDINSKYDEMDCDECFEKCCGDNCPLCDYCDDEEDELKNGESTTTPTIAERLKEVCTTKDANKELENALNHVKDAVTDAIAGDFTTNAKYAELIPDKGIKFINDPIICSILANSKCIEFHDRILGEFGFKTLLTHFEEINGKKTHEVTLLY